MTYTKHDEWADSLYNSEDVASPGVADMIAERLNAQATEIDRLQEQLQSATNALNAWKGDNDRLLAENVDLKERFRDLRVGPRPTGGWPYEAAAEAAGEE